ncbi:MAG: hypothetical protein AABY03_00045 [Nanoarchaeota archaeon]
MNKKRLFGYAAIIIGLFLISFPTTITGAVIETNFVKGIKIVFGLSFVISGIVLVISGLERLRRARTLNARELKNIAEEMGYRLINVKEGSEVLDENGNPITVIPHHREVSQGTYHGIKKALLSGESNFRRYNSEH